MKQTRTSQLGIGLALSSLALGLTVAFAQTPGSGGKPLTAAEQTRFYETQVQPILNANCISCHGAGAELSGGLRLNSRVAILKGGVSGPAVNLQKPQESLLVKAIHYQGRQMPPTGKLSQSKIDTLTQWVMMGLPMTPASEAPNQTAPKFGPPPVNAQTMNFWSFRPVKRPTVPTVRDATWVKTPIDAFVLAKLEAKGLKPAPSASRAVLIRRAYYDLIGLPPSPQAVQEFLADKSPDAWERLIDRLLASPQYGERWGRHWLDLVRYAETNSFERDNPKPYVWRYRDYIIRSLNEDKPYDQFIREQLAGDELEQVTPDTLIATGYYRLGQWDDEPADPEQARYDELDDIVATTGQTFLGLTVNCARCHDHKLDPIPQKDYYKLVSFFQGITRYGPPVDGNSLRPIAPPAEQQRFDRENGEYKRKLQALNAGLMEIETIARKDFSPVEKEEFRSEMNRISILKKRVPKILSEAQFQRYASLTQQRRELMKSPPRGMEEALCVTEQGVTPPPTHILLRGNPHVPGDEVTPGFLSVLAPPNPDIHPSKASSGRRLALANWIASPNNQLTARVMVNRIWQYHFGRGIVRSTSNFGSLGTIPTHPELLDWLASEFVAKGWKLKPLHKMLMLSSAYKMSSQGEPNALAKDPENDLLWRFDMRRLEAEEIRDSILAVNGSLNPKMYGPPIYPTIPQEVLAGQSHPGYGWEKSTPEEQARRSIYIHIKRSLSVPLLASFDAADTDFTCPVRFATTQPTQALSMINSVFLNGQARIFAEALQKQAGSDPRSQVTLALWRTLQREPKAKEIERGVKFIQSAIAEQHISPAEALRFYCVVALNLNEFVYVD